MEHPPRHQTTNELASVGGGLTTKSISIVLPAYNEEMVIADTVATCLRAAERYCPNVAVIVVNDGSRDRTGAIIYALATKDARVVPVHHPTNRGYGAAFLACFAAAHTDLLFFMDGAGQFDTPPIALSLPAQSTPPPATAA